MTSLADLNGNPHTVDERFLGTWALLTYQLIGSRGRIRYPYGEDAIGYIVYGADGFMSVSIMRRNRQPFAGSDILRRTAKEAAEATRTYLSYCGQYEIQSDRVIHHIKMSFFPNWTDTPQERFYSFDGGRLHLSSAPIRPDVTRPRALLIWERTSGAHPLEHISINRMLRAT